MIIQTLKVKIAADDLGDVSAKYIPEGSRISDLEFSFEEEEVKIKGKCVMPLVGKAPLNVSVKLSVMSENELGANFNLMGMGAGITGFMMSFLDKKLGNIDFVTRDGNTLAIDIKKALESKDTPGSVNLISVKVVDNIQLELKGSVDLKNILEKMKA